MMVQTEDFLQVKIEVQGRIITGHQLHLIKIITVITLKGL